MRSLYIYTHGFPRPDGHATASRLSWLHLTLLAARGEVDLLALLPLKEAASAPTPALADLCRRLHAIPSPPTRGAALRSVLAGAARGLPPALALKSNAEAAALLRQALDPARYDLLAFHSTDGLINLPARLPPRPNRPALALFSEEIQWSAWRGYSPLQGRTIGAQQAIQSLLWRRMRAFEKNRFSSLDAVFCLSPREEEAVKALDPAIPTRLLPLPLDAAALNPAPAPATEPVVLFTGFFGHPPNRLAALELTEAIMPRVRKILPTARLRLVGRGAAGLPGCAGPGVERADSLPSLEPEYRAAAVTAGPLRTGEGVRGKFLEALACGCPVVTTPLGASGICASEAEGLIVRQSPAELADAILRLLGDPAEARRLGLAGREAVLQRHSPAAFEAALQAGLEPLLAAAGRRS
jgi:glycosyltransferase involved in cell wall biosynthesis